MRLIPAAAALSSALCCAGAADPPLQAGTAAYLKLLEKVDWLNYVEGRLTGTGSPGPDHPFATWSDGWAIRKSGGTVAFTRTNSGDNDGIYTGPVLQSVCHALKLWPDLSPRLSPMLERLVNGMSAWIMGMKRNATDDAAPLLARNIFPPDAETTYKGYKVTMSNADLRHADSEDTCSKDVSCTIRIPGNPYWGDLYMRAKRSQDDIGVMFGAQAAVLGSGCLDNATASLSAAVARMRKLFAAWGAQVEKDGWKIATLDLQQRRYVPSGHGGAFQFTMLGNAECCGPLALSYASKGDKGALACGDGIEPPEAAAKLAPAAVKDDLIEMARTQHEAATAWALLIGSAEAATLRGGFADRLTWSMGRVAKGDYPAKWHEWNLMSLITHAAALGAPLPAAAAAWAHAQINTTSAQFDAADQSRRDAFRVFRSDTPDGSYEFMPRLTYKLGMPDGYGIKIEDLGMPLGACGSGWRSSTAAQLLDCDMVRAWRPLQ